MADIKNYYYLKIKENFFDSPEIKVLESMQNGYKYSNLLLKLYLKSIRFNGALRLNEFIPYSPDMIAAITNIDIDTVKVAFDLFEKLKLIEILSDGTIYMLDIQNFIGKSSSEADRIRLYREEIKNKKAQLLPSKDESVQMYNECTPEIEIEKEIELKLEKELELKLELELEEKNSKAIPNNLQQVVDAWNSLGLTKLKSIKNKRLQLLKSRIKENSLDDVLEAIKLINYSDFLRGQNDKNWIITFDWLIKPNNFIKVLEGTYTSNNKRKELAKERNSGFTDRSSVVELTDDELKAIEEGID